jgi:hypothetical protein
MEAVAMETASMEAATVEATTVEATTVEATTVEATAMETAAVETAASVKPTAPAMRTSVSGARLAQRSSEQESSCGSSQNPAHSGPNAFFA